MRKFSAVTSIPSATSPPAGGGTSGQCGHTSPIPNAACASPPAAAGSAASAAAAVAAAKSTACGVGVTPAPRMRADKSVAGGGGGGGDLPAGTRVPCLEATDGAVLGADGKPRACGRLAMPRRPARTARHVHAERPSPSRACGHADGRPRRGQPASQKNFRRPVGVIK